MDAQTVGYNYDLLNLIPSVNKLIEVGCNTGALAAAYKAKNADCYYIGVELSEDAATKAKGVCDAIYQMNVETADDAFFEQHKDVKCWIFGDVLEHLIDPWRLLERIRKVISPDAYIMASIPNAQHWSVQARLSIGDFRYEDYGLFDRTHLRWFTRVTILEMFQKAGFAIVEGVPRVFNDPARDLFLPAIRQMAEATGNNGEQAVQDALPLQYVIKAKAA